MYYQNLKLIEEVWGHCVSLTPNLLAYIPYIAVDWDVKQQIKRINKSGLAATLYRTLGVTDEVKDSSKKHSYFVMGKLTKYLLTRPQ